MKSINCDYRCLKDLCECCGQVSFFGGVGGRGVVNFEYFVEFCSGVNFEYFGEFCSHCCFVSELLFLLCVGFFVVSALS